MKLQENIIEIQENDMEHLLMQYCQGTLSGEERSRVEAWLEESPEHRRLASQIEMLYLATDTLQLQQTLNTEKALKKVKRRMSASRRTVIWMWMQRAAAILFLPVLTALLVEYFTREDDVRMMEVRTNPGMIATVVLPDNSVVHLNSMSTLRYPSSFRGEEERKVELQGEAFFDVQKNSKQQFIVSTSQEAQVKVYGTRFNVEAYCEDPDITVTLVEGKVGFDYSLKEETKELKLTPGEKVVYNSSSGQIELFKTSCKTETAWVDGKIILENTPAKEVLHILEKRYNVQFTVHPRIKLTGSFTGTFTNQHLDRILEYFKLSVGLRWRYIDKKDSSDVKTHIEIY